MKFNLVGGDVHVVFQGLIIYYVGKGDKPTRVREMVLIALLVIMLIPSDIHLAKYFYPCCSMFYIFYS